MPFQVTFSTRHRQFKQITLRTAGEDQTHICSPTIYLEAEVDGDLSGHFVEWEQISGTTVTLQLSNTLTPFFDAVDGTDKVFRCYVDRGTPYEQYDDVTIWKTPTGICDTSYAPDQQYFNLPLDPQPVECDSFASFVSVTVPPPTSLEGEETGSQTIVEVTWNHPVDTIHQAYIEQYQVFEDGVLVDSLPDTPIWDAGDGPGPPTETLQYNGTFAEYRVDTLYNIAGRKFIRPSCTIDYTTLVAPSVRAYNDSVRGTATNPDQQYFSRVDYTNLFLTNESSSQTSANGGDTYFSRINYSNLVEYGESTITQLAFEPDAQWINITRYDPSGIGSG